MLACDDETIFLYFIKEVAYYYYCVTFFIPHYFSYIMYRMKAERLVQELGKVMYSLFDPKSCPNFYCVVAGHNMNPLSIMWQNQV